MVMKDTKVGILCRVDKAQSDTDFENLNTLHLW